MKATPAGRDCMSHSCCGKSSASRLTSLIASSATFFDRLQNVGYGFPPRLCTEIAFAMNTDADGVGVHVAFSNHKHGVYFHLLGPLDFAVDLVGACVDFCADLMSTQLPQNRSRVID